MFTRGEGGAYHFSLAASPFPTLCGVEIPFPDSWGDGVVKVAALHEHRTDKHLGSDVSTETIWLTAFPYD